MTTTSFKDLNIKPAQQGFIGKKIETQEILNQPIIIHDYHVGPSKYPEKYPFLLKIQITFEGVFRVVFSSSKTIAETLDLIPKEKFPISTIITKNKDSRRLELN